MSFSGLDVQQENGCCVCGSKWVSGCRVTLIALFLTVFCLGAAIGVLLGAATK